jgi:serine protease DegQ
MLFRIAVAVFSIFFVAAFVHADDSVEDAAERLVAATVTIRSVQKPVAEPSRDKATSSASRTSPSADGKGGAALSSNVQPATNEVTVCSGVSLGRGLIVTFRAMPEAGAEMPRFRVTLPGGDQAEALLRVIDRHSGLVLLEIENREVSGLRLAAQSPKIGSAVLTAAAAGLEEPAVSSGILGASDRSLTGVDLPPLLQCDVRTTETSSGAAVVDRHGELLGIVVATAVSGQHSGWTYALPARHVERVIAAKVDGKLIELKRRRPVVGFTIGAGEKEGAVVVERVEQNGPAAAAGIKPGDLIVETDGLKIRSAYQAIDLILKKQPGDRMTFSVERAGARHTLEVLLDGGAMPVAEIQQPADGALVRIGPQLKAMRARSGEITIRDDSQPDVAVGPDRGKTRRSVGNEAELLRLQLGAYERVIESMQKEIESLRRETSQLREQVKQRAK